MILDQENYFSKDAEKEYLSNSQYHNFCGTLGRKGCEFAALAKISGEYEQETTIPMLVGSYVDSHFSATLHTFKSKNPDIFTKKGELKAQFKKAEEVIKRIERDPFFLKFMSGETQRILTGEIGGAKWKCKIDVFHPGKCIVDLKVVKSLRENFWVKDYGHMTFIEYWGIDHQGSAYREIVKQNTGEQLPFFIAGASKEEAIDIEIIGIDDQTLRAAMIEVEDNIERIVGLKAGTVKPDRCGICLHCRESKILVRPLHFSELRRAI